MEICSLFLFTAMLSFVEGALVDTLYNRGYQLSYYAGGEDTVGRISKLRYKCALKMPGSTLVMIKRQRMQRAVEEILNRRKLGKYGAWIGGFVAGYDYYWADGTPIRTRFTNWANGHPYISKYEWSRGSYYVYIDMTKSQWKWFATPYGAMNGFICQAKVDDLIPSYYADLTFSNNNTDPNITVMTYWNASKECGKNQSRIIDVKSSSLFYSLKEKLASDPTLKYWIRKDENSSDCLVMGSSGWLRNDCDDPTIHYVCEQIRPWNVTISEEFPLLVKEESITIDCTASGYPVPLVSWFKNDEEITQDSNKRIHQVKSNRKARLIIKKSKISDKGLYHCYANSSNHHARGYAKIRVKRSADVPGQTVRVIGKRNFDSLQKNFMTESFNPITTNLTDLPSKFSPQSSIDPTAKQSDVSNQEICELWKLIVFIAMSILWIVALISIIIYSCYKCMTSNSASHLKNPKETSVETIECDSL